MPFALIAFVVEILLIVHVLKTGRDFRWIFLLLFLPGIGAVVYLVIEVLPGMTGSATGRRTARRVGRLVDPGRDLRQQKLEYDRNRSVETTTRLAAELVRDGKCDEAIEVCERAREGLFADDPTLLLALANAQFGKGSFDAAIASLDTLREKNPDFRSPDGHLLYARALESAGRSQEAIAEYEALAGYYPGAEARVRLAQLHQRLGNHDVAAAMFGQIVEDARLAPKHFQRAQREWIDIAKKAL
jgi:hypothetical protein